jgi:hypothetical protein
MVTRTYRGLLEIDPERGVIYFHDESKGITLLRICSLPKPIPIPEIYTLDVTHMVGANWNDETVAHLKGVSQKHG